MDQDKTFLTPKGNLWYYRWSCVSASSSKQFCYMLSCLTNRLIDLESKHPCSGIILLGDFSQLNISRLTSINFGLNQIVNFGTRGPKTLDKVFTNLNFFYYQPIKQPGFGLSDHSFPSKYNQNNTLWLVNRNIYSLQEILDQAIA